MQSIPLSIWSSIGKKFLMGFTGLGLVAFVIMHMVGNFLLFSNDPDPFNAYSHFLTNLGMLLYVVEFSLLLFFVLHSVSGVSVWLNARKARPVQYEEYKSAGHPSKQNFSSVSMVYTGVLLGIFLVVHIITFKYGPYYTTEVDGVEMRDLYQLVSEVFSNPLYVAGYVIVMIFLGSHLRHGFWSAFQSLAFYHRRYTPVIYVLGYIIAIVLAAGYIAIPVWVYFKGRI
jgi:succinate dehydrogenase / fumarate reductase cytochrome b subunit